jgi:hypothetical protein
VNSNGQIDERPFTRQTQMKNFTLFIVPALIALAMVSSAIFIAIGHPGQNVPDFMINSLTMILGYYFGVGAGKS